MNANGRTLRRSVNIATQLNFALMFDNQAVRVGIVYTERCRGNAMQL